MISACCSERRLILCIIVASIVKAYVRIMAGIVELSVLPFVRAEETEH